MINWIYYGLRKEIILILRFKYFIKIRMLLFEILSRYENFVFIFDRHFGFVSLRFFEFWRKENGKEKGTQSTISGNHRWIEWFFEFCVYEKSDALVSSEIWEIFSFLNIATYKIDFMLYRWPLKFHEGIVNFCCTFLWP